MVVVAWLLADLDRYRADIQAAIGSALGRDVSIAGDLDLGLLPTPHFDVSGIHVGNADWGSDADMLRIGRLRGHLALLPLLAGTLRIERVDIVDAELLLETGPDGRGNWALGGPDRSEPPASTAGPRVGELAVRNLQIRWRDGAAKTTDTYRIGRIDIAGLGTPGPTDVSAGPPDDAPSPVRWALRLQVETTATGYRLRDIDLAAGDSDLRGTLEYATGPDGARLHGQLASQRLRPADLRAALAGIAARQPSPTPTSGDGERLFSTAPLAIALPTELDADIAYRATRIDTPAVVLEAVSARLRLTDRVLHIEAEGGRVADGRVTSRFTLDNGQSRPRVQLEVDANGMALGQLLHGADGRPWLESRADLVIDVKGSGQSPADIVASLSGSARLLAGSGRADLQTVDTLVGGLSALLTALAGGDRKPAVLNCVAGSFDIARGTATSRLLIADTAHATVYGEGTIDLGRERLNLHLRPRPKQTSLNVAVPVQIVGPLRHPDIRAEKTAVARKGAGVLAAAGVLAFPPAILLGLGELGTGEPNPCLDIAARNDSGAQAAGSPKSDRNLLERGVDKADAALKGIGSAVKGLFD